jgi:hypothetical protein
VKGLIFAKFILMKQIRTLGKWLRIATKAFVNDCSIGLTLIILGFLLGWMSQSVWLLLSSLYVRIR